LIARSFHAGAILKRIGASATHRARERSGGVCRGNIARRGNGHCARKNSDRTPATHGKCGSWRYRA